MGDNYCRVDLIKFPPGSVDYINSQLDAALSCEEFQALVKRLVSTVSMLSWIWRKAPGFLKLSCI